MFGSQCSVCGQGPCDGGIVNSIGSCYTMRNSRRDRALRYRNARADVRCCCSAKLDMFCYTQGRRQGREGKAWSKDWTDADPPTCKRGKRWVRHLCKRVKSPTCCALGGCSLVDSGGPSECWGVGNIDVIGFKAKQPRRSSTPRTEDGSGGPRSRSRRRLEGEDFSITAITARHHCSPRLVSREGESKS